MWQYCWEDNHCRCDNKCREDNPCRCDNKCRYDNHCREEDNHCRENNRLRKNSCTLILWRGSRSRNGYGALPSSDNRGPRLWIHLPWFASWLPKFADPPLRHGDGQMKVRRCPPGPGRRIWVAVSPFTVERLPKTFPQPQHPPLSATPPRRTSSRDVYVNCRRGNMVNFWNVMVCGNSAFSIFIATVVIIPRLSRVAFSAYKYMISSSLHAMLS